MFADFVDFMVNPRGKTCNFRGKDDMSDRANKNCFLDDSVGTLLVTGFLRGVPMHVNNLVNIPALGDFQMNRIDAPTDIFKAKKKRPTER